MRYRHEGETVEEQIRREWRRAYHAAYSVGGVGALRLRFARRYGMPCWQIRDIVHGLTAEESVRERELKREEAAKQEREAVKQEQWMRRSLTWMHHALSKPALGSTPQSPGRPARQQR